MYALVKDVAKKNQTIRLAPLAALKLSSIHMSLEKKPLIKGSPQSLKLAPKNTAIIIG